MGPEFSPRMERDNFHPERSFPDENEIESAGSFKVDSGFGLPYPQDTPNETLVEKMAEPLLAR